MAFGESKEGNRIPIASVNLNDSIRACFIVNKQNLISDPDELHKYFRKFYVLDTRSYTYIGQCPIRQSR